MLVDFFFTLKSHRLPVSIKEFLTLLEALEKGVIGASVEEFYYLSRTTLVKDEANFDKFDRAFAEFWNGVKALPGIEAIAGIEAQLLPEWQVDPSEFTLGDNEKHSIAALGAFERLVTTLEQRIDSQRERRLAGGKGAASLYGSRGLAPLAMRIRQRGLRTGGGGQVWDQREYQNLDDSVELGTRNIKIALRRLRRFAREGVAEEFDLDTTVSSTAKKAYLDIHMRPERKNAVKVLMLLDIGGSMDSHVKLCEEMFSAAKAEFKHMEYYYFHNCLYDHVWKDNRRRHAERTRTWDLLHKYGQDYKVIFVGDATMGPSEILEPGGSIEYFNEESGAVWLKRVTDIYSKCIWLNPQPESYWPYRHSVQIMKEMMGGRMFPTTIAGLEKAMRLLAK